LARGIHQDARLCGGAAPSRAPHWCVERTGHEHREAARRIVIVADSPETQCVESRAHMGVWIETVASTWRLRPDRPVDRTFGAEVAPTWACGPQSRASRAHGVGSRPHRRVDRISPALRDPICRRRAHLGTWIETMATTGTRPASRVAPMVSGTKRSFGVARSAEDISPHIGIWIKTVASGESSSRSNRALIGT
jgi:hypothetical protein